jgi:hypothetical protein
MRRLTYRHDFFFLQRSWGEYAGFMMAFAASSRSILDSHPKAGAMQTSTSHSPAEPLP